MSVPQQQEGQHQQQVAQAWTRKQAWA
jgi:hypothetical protein